MRNSFVGFLRMGFFCSQSLIKNNSKKGHFLLDKVLPWCYIISMKAIKNNFLNGEYKMTISETILTQLGGQKFIAMTGAKNFISEKSALSMKIGKNNKNITHVKIELTPLDTYKIIFYKIRGVNIKIQNKISGIYADMLQQIFTEKTGLNTYL